LDWLRGERLSQNQAPGAEEVQALQAEDDPVQLPDDSPQEEPEIPPELQESPEDETSEPAADVPGPEEIQIPEPEVTEVEAPDAPAVDESAGETDFEQPAPESAAVEEIELPEAEVPDLGELEKLAEVTDADFPELPTLEESAGQIDFGELEAEIDENWPEPRPRPSARRVGSGPEELLHGEPPIEQTRGLDSDPLAPKLLPEPTFLWGKASADWSSGNEITLYPCDEDGVLFDGAANVTGYVVTPTDATLAADAVQPQISEHDVLAYIPFGDNEGLIINVEWDLLAGTGQYKVLQLTDAANPGAVGWDYVRAH